VLKRALSLLLITAVLLAVNPPRYATSIGHTEKSTEVANTKYRADADSDDSKEKDENGEAGGSICGFKYLAYFLWFSFAIIFGCVVFVMDLSTGCTQGFTRDYVQWAGEVTESLSSFFDKIGCGEY
jgi:hypothetical protein